MHAFDALEQLDQRIEFQPRWIDLDHKTVEDRAEQTVDLIFAIFPAFAQFVTAADLLRRLRDPDGWLDRVFAEWLADRTGDPPPG